MGRRRRAQETALDGALARAVVAGIQRGREQGFLSALARIARGLLRRDTQDAARMVEEDGPKRTLGALAGLSRDVWRGRWADGLAGALEAIMEEAPVQTDKGSARLGFDVSNPKTARYFETYRLRLAKQVTDTTREKLEAAIREGIEEGLSVPEVARKVSQAGEEFAGYRSELIARTELHRAATESAEIQARNSGVVNTRTWLTAHDERVRATHRALDGVTVGMDEAFLGGIRSPADEVNCRCTLVFGVDTEALNAPEAVEMDTSKREFRPATDEDRKRLKIPPGWKDAQVASREDAALQATGIDAKGRKQYIYSAKHHEEQGAAKFARIAELRNRLPEIDSRLTKDAETDDSALAALLIRRMGLRPGSDVDTKAEKKAYGATNLKASHIKADGGKVRANFTGKKGVELDLELDDPELARLLEGRQRDKGDNDRLLDTDERKLRTYMGRVAPGVKPKDFRTYLGTATARALVDSIPAPDTEKEYKKRRNEVGKAVSKLLGNTPAVALSSYIAPSVFGPWDEAMISRSD